MRPNRERYPRPRVIHSYFRYDGSEEPAVAQSNRRRHDQIQNSRGDQAAEDYDRHGAFNLLARLAGRERQRQQAQGSYHGGHQHRCQTRATHRGLRPQVSPSYLTWCS